MSISSMGAAGSGDPSQILMRMLSRLNTTNGAASPENSGAAASASPSAPQCAAGGPLTGTSQSALSDRILSLLVQLQQQSPTDATPAGANTATSSTSATDPVQTLFSAMDGNSDGTVSQTEMESYIEGKGGTQAQADAMFSALNQNANGSTGISEAQFSTDASQAQHAGHHHRHHHGGGELGSQQSNATSGIASQIFGALDTNQDGNVSAAEFSAAFAGTSQGGSGTSSIDPSALFAQIDGNNDGSITTGELGTFLTAMADQVRSDFSALGALGQFATQSYGASSALLNQTAAAPSSIA